MKVDDTQPVGKQMPLKDTLASMVRFAQTSKTPTRVRLLHGLAIAIKVSGDVVILQLSRHDVYPSLLEWQKLIDAMPGQCTVVEQPRQVKNETAFYLKGKIKIARELML